MIDLADMRRVREELGRTQVEMAELLGLSPRAVQSYEQGWRPVPAYVQKLAGLMLLLHRNRQSTDHPACWDLRHCSHERREACAAYQFRAANDLCWLVTGNASHGKQHDSWEAKFAKCRRCPVLRKAFSR
jgi:hypothetical protein